MLETFAFIGLISMLVGGAFFVLWIDKRFGHEKEDHSGWES